MHIMLDLETMSLAPNAALVSIGAVQMTNTGAVIDTFYRNVSLQSSVDAGLHLDPGTVMWWMAQSDAARATLPEEPAQIADALRAFSLWIEEMKAEPLPWGNGATADLVWLSEAYRALGWRRPWSYKNERCYRTFRALHPEVEDPPENTEAHNALADALWQAAFVENVCTQKGITLR